jgi:hypothetical protein
MLVVGRKEEEQAWRRQSGHRARALSPARPEVCGFRQAHLLISAMRLSMTPTYTEDKARIIT